MTNPKLCEKISPLWREVNAKRLGMFKTGMFKTGDVHQATLASNREKLWFEK